MPSASDNNSYARIAPGPYGVVARLRTTREKAEAPLQLLNAQLRLEGMTPRDFAFRLSSVGDVALEEFRGTHRALTSALLVSVIVLLGNLWLLAVVRSQRRMRVAALRRCLGAPAWMEYFEALAETVAIVVPATTIAALLAAGIVPAVIHQAPSGLADAFDIGDTYPDWLACVTLSVVGGSVLSAGLLRTRGHLMPGVRTTAVLPVKTAACVLFVQVMCGVVVSAVSISLVQSYVKQWQVPQWTTATDLYAFDIWSSPARFSSPAARALNLDLILKELLAAPQVSAAAVTDRVPFASTASRTARVTSATAPAPSITDSAYAHSVTSGYFDVLGLDVHPRLNVAEFDSQPSVVITQSLSERLFGAMPAVGRSIVLSKRVVRVVGVTADIRLGLRETHSAHVFASIPARPIQGPAAHIVVRLANPDVNAPALLARSVGNASPLQPVTKVQTFANVVSETVRPHTFRVMVFTGTGLVSVILACLGLAATQSYILVERRHEFAVRLSLGATATRLIRAAYAHLFVALSAGVAGGVGLILTVERWTGSGGVSGREELSGMSVLVAAIVIWGSALLATIPGIIKLVAQKVMPVLRET